MEHMKLHEFSYFDDVKEEHTIQWIHMSHTSRKQATQLNDLKDRYFFKCGLQTLAHRTVHFQCSLSSMQFKTVSHHEALYNMVLVEERGNPSLERLMAFVHTTPPSGKLNATMAKQSPQRSLSLVTKTPVREIEEREFSDYSDH
eukprot:2330878-Amphidinium_carterae.1